MSMSTDGRMSIPSAASYMRCWPANRHSVERPPKSFWPATGASQCLQSSSCVQTLPPWLNDTVRRALAKVPADRFRTAAEFRATLLAGPQSARVWRTRHTAILAAAVGGVAVLGLILAGPSLPGPDPNKIMGFPLMEVGSGADSSGEGERAAIMIGRALEHTEPLKWIDGWSRIPAGARENIRQLRPKRPVAWRLALDLASTSKAGWFMLGIPWRSY